ncbi:hypothetical protein CHS0354_012086 [Potamilus streckersoni]|uniref:Heat shock 70 kDa protein n=1 Tax=Potamilus streckersoni TaxID=2493646 RepID=A0AAE0SB03_9BIVA|nr:hypothetical protein CHS0354_012086 [Potamilus streckersoni]
MRSARLKEPKIVVAAIDFGTTYSGYAYSFLHDFKKDPLKILATRVGRGGGEDKMPTTILFTPNGEFHSFKYDAEDKYAKLVANDMHIGWSHFSRFKMKLHAQQKIRRAMELTDDQDHKMPAMRVFAEAIKYLKNQLLDSIQEKVSDIQDTDIHWVLTVPAIWDDGAKQFMREAGNQAGIPDNQLDLALEPEAAAIYCKAISTKKDGSSFDPGTQFILVDLGGGTADITVHTVEESGNLTELSPPSGGPWGGTKVDVAFNTLMEEIYGKSVISSFNKDNKEDALDIIRDFEEKKRVFKAYETVTFRVPSALVEELENSGRTLEKNISGTIYEGKVKQRRDKMHIEGSVISALFDDVKKNIIQQMKEVLIQHPKVNTILMVGGFSESDIIKQAVQKAFDLKKVIIPSEARLAVVKGAVMYGHNPSVIISRSLPYTYGVSVAVGFDDSKHPRSKRVFKDGFYKCEDNFKVFIRAGDTVIPGKTTVRHVCNASSATSANIEIYRTKSKKPIYVDDYGCSCVGSIQLLLSDISSHTTRPIEITMSFGSTELSVQANEEQNRNNAVVAKFNFLH